jgi:hypothetical protein
MNKLFGSLVALYPHDYREEKEREREREPFYNFEIN